MNSISRSLIAAQNKAEALFEEVVGSGMIRAGKLESELTDEIHCLAQARFGLRRHWHTRLARRWILEIHFIDRQRMIGGFLEELLTIDADGTD
jgi:hypothetical protein